MRTNSMSPKYAISSPLEAGTSILLDGRTLPSHLYSALEYVSEKLAKKDVHLTLVIVRRDYQLPSKTSSGSLNRSTSPALPPATSNIPVPFGRKKSGNSGFNFSRIKHKVRSNTFPLAGSSSSNVVQERTVDVHLAHEEGLRTGMISPAFSVSSASSMASTVSTTSTVESNNGSSHAWPLSPASPYSASMPVTPATPLSEGSMVTHTTTDVSSAVSGTEGPVAHGGLGSRLVHTSPVSSKEEKLLKQATQKAERKFHLGPNWFPPAVAPSECNLTADLIHRSLAQNELVFSSSGFSLLTLDHLYTFKSALSAYTATQSSCGLEDAVDELRRLVLAQGGRKLRKSVLQSSFAWLGPVSDSALSDVIRMYRHAYGGVSGESGLEDDVDVPAVDENSGASWPLPDQPVFMISADEDANHKPLPALPDEASQSSSETASESSESVSWESGDLPSLHLSRTDNSDRIQRRFGVLGLEVEDYYRVSPARDLLAEREYAEAAAWAAAGAAGEAVDEADGVLMSGLSERKPVAARPMSPADPGPAPSATTEDVYFLLLAAEEAGVGRVTPKVAPEKPRLQLQTAAVAPPLGVVKPAALRMPMPLKLQTTFEAKPVPPKSGPVAPLSCRLSLSGAETTLVDLAGMTPVGGQTPSFDSLLASHRDNAVKAFQDEEDGDLTARPVSAHSSRQHRWTQRWNDISIDGRLAAEPLEQQGDDQLGPMTPHTYQDISPVTRGEWKCLFEGETWQPGRTVTVETC